MVSVTKKRPSLWKRASLHTLGCRLNQYETQQMKDSLLKAGYRIVPFGEEADLGVINTCTVTRQADSKCRAEIRKFIRKNPHATTVVTGCYSQMGYREIAAIPGVDYIIGNQDKLNLLDYVEPGKNSPPVIIRDRIDPKDFSIFFCGELPFDKRVNLKVQDGCDFACSFCIIPQARGRARSRNFRNLMDEARHWVDRGVRETVLTGVNIGTYQNSGHSLLDLVDALSDLPGLDRIRISSIEPTTIPEALLDRMADPNHGVLPYLHIPLQSGCDKILKAMKRRYTLEEYLDFLDLAVAKIPHVCIGTDILVGYPTESSEDFDKTCGTFMNGPFSYCHVFTFSEREGTRAARYPSTDQIPMPERHRRSAHLRRLSSMKKHQFYQSYLNRRVDVLFEDQRESSWPGYTGNYIRVRVPHKGIPLRNRIAEVRLDAVRADFMEGSLVKIKN